MEKKKKEEGQGTSPTARSFGDRQWRRPVPLGATARARMGGGAVEAKRVGLGSVATFIGQGEGKGSGDRKIQGHQWPGLHRQQVA
jgi:hypothetical protein